MQIRKNQLAAFYEQKIQEFVKVSHTFLELNFPAFYKESSLEQREALIRDAIKFASAYGIVHGENIQKLLVFNITYGSTWYMHPHALDLLQQRDIEECRRIDNLWFLLESGFLNKSELKHPY